MQCFKRMLCPLNFDPFLFLKIGFPAVWSSPHCVIILNTSEPNLDGILLVTLQVSGPIPNSASLTGGFIHPLHTSTGMHNYAGSECDLPTSADR